MNSKNIINKKISYLSNGFKIKLSLLTASLIDIAEVFFVVMLAGGVIFGWFEFVLSDLLIATGVIVAVFLIVFVIQVYKMKADSETINNILKERNSNEKSNSN